MSDAKRIRDYKKSRQPKPPISKAAHRANCEHIVDSLLMPVIEKMRNSPETIQPVADSYESLLAEMRGGVKKQPYIMQANGRRLAVSDDVVTEFEYQPEKPSDVPEKPTLNNSGGAENSDATIVTKFNDEIKILNSLK